MPLAALETPLPMVARENEEKRQFLSSLFDFSTTSNNDGSGGGGSNGGSTGGGGGGSTGNGNTGGGGSTTSSTTSSPSSPSSTSSSPSSTSSSTREQVTSITSSRSSTIIQQTTSNGVVTSVTVVTNAPTVVVSTASAGSETSRPTSGSSSSSNGGLIGGVVGGVVGGLGLLTLLILAIIIWRRRRSRTGHGWLLCFGQRPNKNNNDGLDVDWPTFDPTAGAAGVGGTMGNSFSNRRKSQGYNGGTLPNVDDEEGYNNNYNGGDYNSYNHAGGEDEMREYANSAPSYGGVPTSDNAHYNSQQQQSQQWGHSINSFSNGAHSSAAAAAPDYSHLDAPEVREERARQQAQAQAMAAAAAAAASYSHHSTNSPPQTANGPSRYGSPVGNNSPPPTIERPLSSSGGQMNEHRFSQGTAQMLSDNNFFLSSPQFDQDDNGTVINENQNYQNRPLHLHNPDA